MDDVIVNLDGNLARQVALQFMGQTLGELKELDRNIISKNNTLQGITINPEKVLNSIPVATAPAPAPISPALPVTFTTPAAAVPAAPVFVAPPAPAPTPARDDNQLELNFSYDIVKDMVERQERIEVLLKKILRLLDSDKPGSQSASAPAKILPLKKTT